jgi:electron transport complex protein RnfC
MNLKTFKRGIHPSYHKELTRSCQIKKAVLPDRVVIPLQQHIGAPCSPLVKKGDLVTEGQLIGEAASFVTASVHASISGKVKEVAMHPHPGGGKALSVVIEGDGLEKDWGSVPDDFDVDSVKPGDAKIAIKAAGIVGMGGAAFPTVVKLTPPPERKVHAVLLNGCECEPYLSADHRLMVEEADKVVTGLKLLMRVVSAPRGYIAIEDNKPDAIGAISKALKKAASSSKIKVVVLETKYPQGAEKMLIHAVMGKVVPTGKLPFDVGVLVNNIGTAVAVLDAVSIKKPLIERVVTISGNGIKTPQNLLAKIGTSFEDMLSQCGGLRGLNKLSGEREILNGGPMMGISQTTLQVPVIKGTSGITVLMDEVIKPKAHKNCIKCSSCIDVCPMGLMPYRIADQGRLAMTDDFTKWAGLSCIECGCCSFACPAKRPLVQWIRVGKIKLREALQEKAAKEKKAEEEKS